jgi:uncharacterized protein (TIGR02270 family)
MLNLILDVLTQHLGVATHLAASRWQLVSGPHVALRHLLRADERLAAHLDGLQVAADQGAGVVARALEESSAAGVFVACVCALSEPESGWVDRLFALVEAQPEWLPGITAALGWVEPRRLQGLATRWMDAERATSRVIGLAACAWHRVNPGPRLLRSLRDDDPAVRARAFRTAGELGLRALVSRCAAAIDDSDETSRFWAAWSAVLLGDTQAALDRLASIAAVPGPLRARALGMTIQAMGITRAHEFVRSESWSPDDVRTLIRASGLVGDPAYIPWLISFMKNDSLARIAGEAFTLVTGADLSRLDLERKPPENLESGPNDDPDDPNIDMDEDDWLPWPDQERVHGWWSVHAGGFQPGVRYFMGQPISRENCLRVLKEGYQRQRITAALYLPLLNPGTPLFEWRAPAWRQERLLKQISPEISLSAEQ